MDSYYTQLPDYNDIAEYLTEDPEGFEPEINKAPFAPDFSSTIVVDNVPVVALNDTKRIDKLRNLLLNKVFSAVNQNVELYLPEDEETGKTAGCAFVTYPSAADAKHAIKTVNNYALDKNHIFKVYLYSDMDTLEAVPDEFSPPPIPPFKPSPDPTSWLSDKHCRDQFVVRYAQETEVTWSTQVQGDEPELVYGGEREKPRHWCESYTQWSPDGSYLATFHPPGVKLWGGPDFEAQGRYMHAGVELVDFSPCERFMVTYMFQDHSSNEAIIVWDIRSGEKLRTFKLKNPLDKDFQVQAEISEEKPGGKRVERPMRGRIVSLDGRGICTIAEGNTNHSNIPLSKVTALQDPNRLKWSPDGNYVARLGTGIIQVYSLPSMGLLDKKSLAAKDALDFVWSPKGNYISYWSPAFGNHPAMINIIQMPDRTPICSRKVFDVQDGRMVWQNEGKYLCVRMTKISGKKRSYVLMFFRVCEPEVPVEQEELADTVLDVQWEPSGSRLCLVHGEARSPTISFYGPGVAGKKKAVTKELSLLFSLKGKQCNEVIWSPAGGVVCIAYVQQDSAHFDLHDVDNNVTMASRRHDRCNRIVWDPSGRILATATITPLRQSNLRGMPEDGYNLYTFQGTPICQVRKEKLYQFAWRPRPKDLLSVEQKKLIVKNLRKYEKIFEKEDQERMQQLNTAVQAERRQLAEEFLNRMAVRRAAFEATRPARIALRDGYDSDDDSNYQVVIKLEETIVSSKEQMIA